MDRPDAILAPKRRVGNTLYERVDYVCTWAEAILGLDRGAGQTAHISLLHESAGKGHATMFITGSIGQNLYFPRGHRLQMRERYRWIGQPDGSLYGYLVDEARDSSQHSAVSLQQSAFSKTGPADR